MISPGYIYDNHGGSASITENDAFSKQYLKIDRAKANDSTPNPLEGVPDFCMDGAEYPTYDDPPNNFDDIGGWVQKAVTDEITHYLFFQDDQHYNYNSLHYNGKDFMTAYFAFNFYLISKKTDRAD